jgi:hypothetical protein
MAGAIDLGSLQPLYKEVLLDGKSYMITEASEDSVVKHSNIKSTAAKYDNGRLVKFEGGIHDVEPLLVGLNIYTKEDWDKPGVPAQPLGVEVVSTWVHRIVSKLYEMIRDLTPAMDPLPDTVEELDDRIGKLVKAREELVQGKVQSQPTGAIGST